EVLDAIDRADHEAVTMLVGIGAGLTVREVLGDALTLGSDLAVAEVPVLRTCGAATPTAVEATAEQQIEHEQDDAPDTTTGHHAATAPATPATAAAAADLAGVEARVLLEGHALSALNHVRGTGHRERRLATARPVST